MPTQILNRLNVRHSAKANASVEAKLCSGVEVEVVSETEDWAVIGLIGAADTEGRYAVVNSIVGCVQKKYLAAPDEGKVPDGTVSAVITDTIPYSWGTVLAQAGESVTVIGTSDHPYDYRGGADSLLVRGENARLFWMGFKADVLEPVTYPDVSVKTTAKTALRAAPASDAESLATIRSGVKVQVLLRGEAWTMVKYQDTTGYVMSKHLKFP